MKKEFIRRILSERIVDTKKYRYTYEVIATNMHVQSVEIRRIPLACLDTSNAWEDWELVKTL